MGTWVDFKKLREQLDFATVLEHYQVRVKRRGSQATAACPLPNHQRDGGSPSFSVSLQKGIFQCFRCGAKGNVLDFVAYMERLDPHNPQEFRRAAVMAQERFFGGNPARQAPHALADKPPVTPANQRQTHADMPVLVNEPLDFALKNLDTKPSYLLNRGFTDETIAHFGLGLCTKGTFAGRIVIPLHDLQGRLIGYAGRIVFDESIDEQNPKYLFPSRREREGRVLEFAKSLFVYNGHALDGPVHDLVIVQGFPATWWCWQHGQHDVVALMGATCSVDQAAAIVALTKTSARIWCFTDADRAGEKCAHSLFTEVGQQRFCKWVRPRNGQPTDCDAEQLDELLAWKIEN